MSFSLSKAQLLGFCSICFSRKAEDDRQGEVVFQRIEEKDRSHEECCGSKGKTGGLGRSLRTSQKIPPTIETDKQKKKEKEVRSKATQPGSEWCLERRWSKSWRSRRCSRRQKLLNSLLKSFKPTGLGTNRLL